MTTYPSIRIVYVYDDAVIALVSEVVHKSGQIVALTRASRACHEDSLWLDARLLEVPHQILANDLALRCVEELNLIVIGKPVMLQLRGGAERIAGNFEQWVSSKGICRRRCGA